MCLSEVQWLNQEGVSENTEGEAVVSAGGFSVLSVLPDKYCLFEKVKIELSSITAHFIGANNPSCLFPGL